MIKFFEYNWQVRDEWFDWCEQLSADELLKERTGGVGCILNTLFHIIDVEYSWLRGIQGKEDIVFDFAEYNTLSKVKALSDQLRKEIMQFFNTGIGVSRLVQVPWDKNHYSVEDILHHIIAHEIHHIGQLSVWARELGMVPVSAHFIGRKFNEYRN
ncbi:DinB family protein [Mesobacillus subterraneus]|uniref:DUF664 domain-containing protein n=1 Tax=Mesobacillus subterraneus TaxID=285983 RepID=A0A3R9F3I9_9BACI|nr:DinB family protein [Mesobacillus subterraneus]RSD29067.1 DUF664 domain-containing protein [Mesobacillus subterraneus]